MSEEQTTARRIFTLADAYAPRPPREYIVDGVFAAASLNVVYGAPGSMKSLFMADCAASIAAGTDWLPGALGHEGEGIKVKQSAVYWLDLDNGTDTTHERMSAVAKARSLRADAPFYYESMPNPPYNLADVDDVIELIIKTRDEMRARLIVIDNLGLIAGDVEENTAQMAHVMGTLRNVAERTRAAVVVIHHQRKSNGSGPSSIRAGETLRGHSSIEASLDLALLVMRDSSGQSILVKHTKARGVEPEPVAAKFYFTHKPGTNELETAWFSGAPALQGDDVVKAAVVATIREHGALGMERAIEKTRERLGPSAAWGVKRTRALIKDMVAEGVDVTAQQDGRHVLVSLPDEQQAFEMD